MASADSKFGDFFVQCIQFEYYLNSFTNNELQIFNTVLAKPRAVLKFLVHC